MKKRICYIISFLLLTVILVPLSAEASAADSNAGKETDVDSIRHILGAGAERRETIASDVLDALLFAEGANEKPDSEKILSPKLDNLKTATLAEKDADNVQLLLQGTADAFIETSETYGEALAASELAEAYNIYTLIGTELNKLLTGETIQTRKYAFSGGVESTCFFVSLSAVSYSVTDNYIHIALASVLFDYPLMTSSLGNYYAWGGNDKSSYVLLECYGDPAARTAELLEKVNAFDAAFESDGVAEDATYLQYKYIHDYLCARLQYNNDEVSGRLNGAVSLDTHSAYGALVGLGSANYRCGEVVCQGYTEAFRLLCQIENLPCVSVTGGQVNSAGEPVDNHTWNVVKLDESWYSIDATWDDRSTYKGASFSWGFVNVSIYCYTYFLDNRYFSPGEERQNHVMLNHINGAHTLAPPTLATGSYLNTTTLTAASISLYPALNDEASAIHFSDVQQFLQNGGLSGMQFCNIPLVDIHLTAPVHFSTACTIADGQSYLMQNASASDCLPLKRSAAYTGALFDVSSGASLFLMQLDVLGEDTVSSPLIQTERAEISKTGEVQKQALLYFADVTVSGNSGAAGIDAEAKVLVSGKTRIFGNWADTSKTTAANLDLHEHGRLWVIASLDNINGEGDGKLGISALGEREYITFFDGARQADRSVVTLDSGAYYRHPGKASAETESMASYAAYYWSDWATMAEDSVDICNLSDTENTFSLYIGVYDSLDRLIELRQLGETVSIEAGSFATFVMPADLIGGSRYQVFLLRPDMTPWGASLIWRETT